MDYFFQAIQGPISMNACLRAVEKERQAQADECSSGGTVSGKLLNRLMDLLHWLSGSGFQDHEVLYCRSMMTDGRVEGGAGDAIDLAMQNHAGGDKVRFMVSGEVEREGFGENEERSLVRLGVLPSNRGDEIFHLTWPEGRIFMVVSGDYAKHLMEMRIPRQTRGWITRKHCHYCETRISENTCLLEIRTGGIPCGGVESAI